MALRSWTMRFCAAAVLGLPLTLQAQVSLELKIPDDQKSVSTAKITSNQILTVAGMPIESGSEQEMEISTVNGKRNEEGVIRQEQKIDSLKAKLTLPGGINLEYDSAQPNAPAPGTQFDILLDLLKLSAKSKWTVVRGKDNRVTAIEGRDKILEGVDEAKRALMQKQLDPEYLRVAANKEIDKLPSKPVNVGDTWEVDETLRLEQGQTMRFKTKYTYKGEVEQNGRQLDKIESEVAEVSYNIEADAALPIKVAGSELKSEQSNGVILFDREKGQTVEVRSKVVIKGTITFEQNGNKVPAQLDLTLASETVTK